MQILFDQMTQEYVGGMTTLEFALNLNECVGF